MLVGIMAILLLGLACSSGEDRLKNHGDGERDDMIRASGSQGGGPEEKEADGGLGEAVRAGGVSLRVFDVRSADRIYAISRPGAKPVTKGGGFGEFVAVDYVARNLSGSPLTTKGRAILVDDQGNAYGQARIEPPAGGVDGMELGTGQKRASTMFFQVPNGVYPERLEVRKPSDVARIDLLDTHPEEIPPEDYLHVYHAYFNEKESEEAYEMIDPASVQRITLGEWLTFFEPMWGERYLNLDSLKRVSVQGDRATFEIERTFYDEDGDPVPDPEIDASVSQEMVRIGDEWKLVMGGDLASDIIAVIGPDETPRPETTTPETTIPEVTAPEPTQPSEPVPEPTQPSESVPERTQRVEGTTPEATTTEATTVTEQGPDEVLASQYELINAGDYGAAYALFDAASQRLVSAEQYGAYFASLAPYEITSYSFSTVREQEETAILVVDLTVSSSAGVERYQVSQEMVLEEGGWRAVMRPEQVASFTAAG
ncbi:MAG: DUF4352 domain-containing protein [Actinomycetota bacterium]|nr:DUF4352 domain-containing protein [Actinomycetota bacterium]